MLRTAIAILSLAVCAFAQGDARIVGTVSDANGAVIPGAKVVAVNQKTSAERTATASESGYYVIANLAPAVYRVTVIAPGMGSAEFTQVTLSAGQERNLNAALRPAAFEQMVIVSGGELAAVDTSSARIGANVNEREVAALPLNGRQLSQLYLLAPGAQSAGGGSFDNIRFSGRANQQNAVRFDGVEASSIIDASPGNLNGETSSGFRLTNSLENVQEFRVESSNYPAEYGTGTGGQISIVTKSGGNALHGGIFEYVRNDVFDARNFFDKASVNPLRLNQYGGSVGGPIVKDKLFFFSSVEMLNQRSYQNLIAAVPSAAARTRAVASIKPLMDAYPNGVPTSNPDLDLAQIVGKSPIDEYFGGTRLDYRVNDKISAVLRYNRDQGYLETPIESTSVAGAVQRVTSASQNALLSVQQLLTSSFINETKLGFNGAKTRLNGVAPGVNGIDLSAISIDFTGSTVIAGIGGQGVSGSAARLGGLIRSNSSQNGRAQPYTNYTMSFIDQASWVKAKHNLKFGIEFRPIRLYTDRLGATTYTFTNLNALLANLPSSVTVNGDASAPNPLHGGASGNRFVKQMYSIAYAQDEWKIRPNFTISYGMRYEYYAPLHEDRGLFTFFDMTTGDLNSDPKHAWYQSSKLNFGPRLAFTWSPGKLKNNTVLRIGSGYYYGPGQTEDQIQPIDSDRVIVTQTSNVTFPVNSQAIVNSFHLATVSGFQPRVYAPGYKLPEKILSYTASIQQQLPLDAVLTLAYVGSQGRNLFLRSWTNGIIGVTMNPVSGVGVDIRQFGSRFAQMDVKTSGGTDHYDSLQMSLNRRYKKGLTLGTQWTYGHSIGNTGGSNEAQTQQNPFDYHADRGNNAFDVRHSFNATALYELPLARKNRLLGGWEIGTVLNARTGLPVDLTIARNDLAYRNTTTGQITSTPVVVGGVVQTVPVINNPFGGAFRGNRRPSVASGVDPYLSNPGDKRVYLNPAAFTIPAPGEYGNLGRWALHGPGLAQVDLTLHKRFAVTERVNFEFRAEVYNAFNKANFANPGSRLTDAVGTGTNQLQPGQAYTAAATGGSFGLITSTVAKDIGLGAGRQLQLSLRLNF